jgi:hypothetical protein
MFTKENQHQLLLFEASGIGFEFELVTANYNSYIFQETVDVRNSAIRIQYWRRMLTRPIQGNASNVNFQPKNDI